MTLYDKPYSSKPHHGAYKSSFERSIFSSVEIRIPSASLATRSCLCGYGESGDVISGVDIVVYLFTYSSVLCRSLTCSYLRNRSCRR